MCKGPTEPAKPVFKRKHSLLLTKESFDYSDEKHGEEFAPNPSPAPTQTSTCITIAFVIVVLCVFETLAEHFLEKNQHIHPLFESENNRAIMARHLGVDIIALGTCALLGLKNIDICKDVFSCFLSRSKKSMPEAGYETRLFTYHPAGQQLLLIFFAYNIKNLYDSYIWEDGPEFLFHHIVSATVAWAGMYPGCGHFYAIFFMGLSECSTAVLSLLAGFDDNYGVVGLGDAFPMTKIVLGVTFAISFIIFRATLWPAFTYFIFRDYKLAFKMKSEKLKGRENALTLIIVICGALTVLQAIWLVQIFIEGRNEIMKLLEAE
uniref:TLC domain-containing protein n=1 Tax=Helicotheca tamesis TaxID=374047 RepID=A0A7S2GRQ8_9STRA|mmetsp:Transcript_10241/g.14308  ORF Transcript_10241/g.14308 Transcript_10241/m.14308 type:complete len:320 (+) Transcript_10241:176-1135(+)|eukprot:CAMPEP_0185725838 /NCGR_PEP_ID=MMETSP1171-20130828/1990_1 /TAXON_ID=374046 /ORGANISM="Helicotheca tamensis, Strain CCMP826" /LENGTH=319 /DNA_ID=CAMNT_0028394059 /DNA_START=130 /DNA_END=1089 /DNA_ORIENTATION=-